MGNCRLHILREAYRLFLSNNVEKVTISEIEKATKKIRGTIFYHFKDKQSIFEAVINEIFLPLSEIPPKVIITKNSLSLCDFIESYKSPEERIIDGTNKMFQIEDAGIHYYDFLSQAGKYCPDFRTRYIDVINNEFVFLNNIIKKNRGKENSFSYTEEELARIIMLLKTGFVCVREYAKNSPNLNYNDLFKKIFFHICER